MTDVIVNHTHVIENYADVIENVTNKLSFGTDNGTDSGTNRSHIGTDSGTIVTMPIILWKTLNGKTAHL